VFSGAAFKTENFVCTTISTKKTPVSKLTTAKRILPTSAHLPNGTPGRRELLLGRGRRGGLPHLSQHPPQAGAVPFASR